MIAADWVSHNLDIIATAATEQLFASNPALLNKYGERGRKRCNEDAHFHLHYLCEAIANDSDKLFVDYVGWAKIMLLARGIETADLARHLEALAEALKAKAPLAHRDLMLDIVDAARTALPALPQTLPSAIQTTNAFHELATTYLNLLLNMKGDEGISLISRNLKAGLTIPELFEYIIYPVQREVGRLWQENKILALQEHYCTAVTETLVLGVQRKSLGIVRQVNALCICPENEHHSLALKMLSELLKADGWHVTYIGPNCPNTDILRFLKNSTVDLLALSVTTPLSLPNARDLIGQIRSLPRGRVPRVIVGGLATDNAPQLCRNLQADAVAPTVMEGLAVANRLVASPEQRKTFRNTS